MIAPRRAVALIEEQAGPHRRTVLDTGRRERHVLPPTSTNGKAHPFVLALVHVDGESEPRWIAVERLNGSADRKVRAPLTPEERRARERERKRLERAAMDPEERRARDRAHQRAKRARDRAGAE